ncbi:DsrE/DsrF/DrsH-like family protein [Thiomicrorhabdus xiamenensis]|uniref:DsrE/DsrF/DrsH-like family protein n=1 Tax=Thiomicrorhabdus xiamenensis TaxID=2739063 RepID=A0A7D4P3Q6_9GAMM|nr:DsrE/DsrF/DrsH-like family protein [Thiomicrorhabdus xiamenensis]QKI88756.1 DsrE/DsrF/DrsH-like family protein [Thiomicrorhabdus xiamenensis]
MARQQLSIIHTKGSLDWAYPTFILASTAAAMDKQVEVFFTFYGLQCALKETKHLRVSPVGNPGMKMHLPVGPDWLRQIDMNRSLPGFLWQLPGMEVLATWGFKKQLLANGQVPVDELRALCVELGVQMTACQMSVDLMGFREEEFIESIQFAGAATYFAVSPEQQSLFI